MFVNEDYLNYKYVVGVSDNYVVLTNQHTVNASWDSPRTIDIVYQYLKPSYLTIEGERTFSNTQTFEQIDVDDSIFSRADYPDILISALLFISVVVFTIINSLTKIVRRGGVLNGNG